MANPKITAEELRITPLFNGLDDEQLKQVIATASSRTLDEEEHLFNQGDTATRFYMVRSGQIKLYRLSPMGTEKVIEVIQAGNTFAEAVMFMEAHKFPVNAEALIRTEVLAFDNKTFLSVLRDSTDTCFSVMAGMSKRLKKHLNEIDALSLQNGTLRLVSYLLAQLPDNSDKSADIELSIPKSIIASRVSIKPETLSRIIHNLAAQGLIAVDGKTIKIHNIDALRSQIH